MLQCTHKPRGAASVRQLVDEVGITEQRTGHRDELEAFVERRLDRGELVDPTEQHQRHVERVAELAGERKEERFLERVLREDPMAEDPQAEPDEARLRRRELLHRDVAPEEVHPVEQRAPAGELERVEVTVGLEEPGELEALVEPEPAVDTVGHVELREHGDAAVGDAFGPLRRPAGEVAPGSRCCRRTRRCGGSGSGS